MLLDFKKWCEQIVVVVIIVTILELIIPENKNKKYINTVIGCYILFIIISPIITQITGKDFSIDKFISQENISASKISVSNVGLLENTTNIEDLYISKLKEEITYTINKAGYKVNYIDVEVNLKNNSGEILGLNLNVSVNKNSINTVDEILIDTSLNDNNDKCLNNVSEGQLNNLKELLMNTYGIEKNQIHINR